MERLALATRQSYQANSDIVKGWIWHSALDERTCAACWAMHGTEHRLDERLDDHPNGRCAMVPQTATWAEIGEKYGVDLSGVPETGPRIEPGVSIFDKLTPRQKILIVGQAKYEAMRQGKITLTDLVGRRRSNVWGTHRYEKSLAELNLNAREFYVAPKRRVFGMDTEQLLAFAKEIDVELEKMFGGVQKWNQRIHIVSSSGLPNAWGIKEWNCAITLRDDADELTLIHELLHGRSKGLTHDAYQNNRGLEEGVVEMLAWTHGNDILNKFGRQSNRPGPAYADYVNALEKIRERLKMDKDEFYKGLYKTELSKRRNFLIRAANDEIWIYDILYYDLGVK